MKRKNRQDSTFLLAAIPFYFWFDLIMIAFSSLALTIDFLNLLVSKWDTAILSILAVIGLLPVIFSALKALIHRFLTIDLLASIALIFALVAQEWRSAVFISLMLASARLFARYTENRSQKSIKGLLKLKPARAHILIAGKPIRISIEEIEVGDLILVEAGERIAVDGEVLSGEALVDQSSLTGESKPVAKKEGDSVLSSTLNISGSLVVKTTKVGEDTTFSKILELVEKSQESKTPIASITESFTKWYIIITLAGALAVFYFTSNLALILSILLVTCADDIAVAIPLVFTAAIGKAAKLGIIVKGGNFLEGLTKTKIMIFDKTGTLTAGKMKVGDIKTFENYPLERFLSFLGALESESCQPIAKAIQQLVAEKNIKVATVNKIHEEPGLGIKGVVGKEEVIIGRLDFLKDNKVKLTSEEKEFLSERKDSVQTLVAMAVDKKLVGFVALADSLKPSAKHVIEKLRVLGLEKTVMLTGDNERVAASVAQEIKVSEFKANLLPEDKIDYLKSVISPNYKVAMVGDGVNDAAALALADIGIAMGAIGSDAAIENANIVLMKDRLSNILELMNLSRFTMKIVYQNIFLWAFIQVLGLILVFAGFLGPEGSAAYNFLTDFLPLINSLRLFRLKLRSV